MELWRKFTIPGSRGHEFEKGGCAREDAGGGARSERSEEGSFEALARIHPEVKRSRRNYKALSLLGLSSQGRAKAEILRATPSQVDQFQGLRSGYGVRGVTKFDRDWKPALGWVVTKGSGPLKLELGDRLTFEGPGDGSPDSILKVSGRPIGDQCRYDPSSDMLGEPPLAVPSIDLDCCESSL